MFGRSPNSKNAGSRPTSWTLESVPGKKSSPEKELNSGKLAFLHVLRAYEIAKSEINAADFPDLINLPIEILESKPELVEELRKKYPWVMVDEYQDVSRSVAHLLTKICGPANPPWVVGDLRQAIYVFCGAAPRTSSISRMTLHRRRYSN